MAALKATLVGWGRRPLIYAEYSMGLMRRAFEFFDRHWSDKAPAVRHHPRDRLAGVACVGVDPSWGLKCDVVHLSRPRVSLRSRVS